jgi:predicted  nucleic acid-binding Zn-ribbon protein
MTRLNEDLRSNADTMVKLEKEIEEMRSKKSNIQIEIKDLLLKKLREQDEMYVVNHILN